MPAQQQERVDINNNPEQSRKNVDATRNTALNQGQEIPVPSQGSHANDGGDNAQFDDGFSISFQGRGGFNICRGRWGWEINGGFNEGRGSRGWYNKIHNRTFYTMLDPTMIQERSTRTVNTEIGVRLSMI